MLVITLLISTLISPIIVGVVLATYEYWLNNRKR
ncbi:MULTISPECIES: type I toxin-antitoxin system Fst family toxin [Staphylococcus]|nr:MULTISPECIES: type I toxin-antitoxin system Fst family toxin [unclassified Staphylococcus]ELJ9074582.1 type I toxin-antitoxin system Fst family toxin [Staphylococcus pseudintermedius]MCG7340263.1 type I toxin-antitoxin system Fst family toxin [Staphylococcus sp. ACRSN]HBI0942398.1 type I toxin-antitoxin system Fst family toxin [Staphylococcus aureus]HDH9653755.1 type I toxin-antitoxin system Fst family toxin [Staphylococcus aureus]